MVSFANPLYRTRCLHETTDTIIIFITDITNLEVRTYMVKAGENKSLPCPNVTEFTLINNLEWVSVTNRGVLVGYSGSSTTTWFNHSRISLLKPFFELFFHPASAEDSGDYVCLVNNRPRPYAVIRLVVEGKYNFSICRPLFFKLKLSRINTVKVL